MEIPVDSLSLGFSPRIEGHDERNVRLLAELDRPWPPLLVHRQTYRVIDGMHRLLAARLRGDRTIEVRLHECDESDAFVLAVRMNVSHGLPLSLNDRKAAARRIIESRPEWSDRRIGSAAGISDKTVAGLRRDSQPHAPGAETCRVGTDGKSRPVDLASRRSAVSRLLTENPEASLREIADRAGVSPETVRSMRSNSAGRETAARPGARRSGVDLDPKRCLQILIGDPALRSTDAGRLLLRVLSTVAFLDQDCANLVEAVPQHDLRVFQTLAIANAEAWRSLAQLAAMRTPTPQAEGTRGAVAA
jgi:ParB-like chromosome segregation protein Spo0J